MNDIKYDDFQNVCRTCLQTCDVKCIQDHVILDVLHTITGIEYEIYNELPQQICIMCLEKINGISAFAVQCKQAHSSLIKCLYNYKNVGSNKDDTNKVIEIKEEEFVKSEELNSTIENIVIDELLLKPESIEESCVEINNDVQDSNEEMSGDNSQQNESNEDINPDNTDCTNIKEVSNKMGERHFECDVCNKSFKKSCNLKVHKRVHTGECPYKCDICTRKFKKSSDLIRHKTKHTGERPYKCDICTKTFKELSTINIHKRVHSDERPFKCNICTKSYKDLRNLKVHQSEHSGERPHECDVCNKNFFSLSHLQQHKKTHSVERPYKCDFCVKTFKKSSHLKRHKETHI